MGHFKEQPQQRFTYWEDVTEITQVASRKKFQTGQEVHTWLASMDFELQIYNMLSPDENVNAMKFRFIRDQHRYITSHAILRIIISKYVKEDSSSIKFGKNKYGKPFLNYQEGEDAVRFNMSYSEGVVCYVVSAKNEVGIDLEYVKSDFDWLGIAKRYFSQKEVNLLKRLPKGNQIKEFFNFWTRKEALLKAKGIGLSGMEETKDGEFMTNSSLVSFNYGEDFIGTLAIGSENPHVRFFRFTDHDG
ncbi:4'-phosphopantetheinyl transferase family protein [Oceanobacillus halophilus]|nr:4'-phosphopantetheinyl transferase superfamily protein [Oceanobacillus halophilus]